MPEPKLETEDSLEMYPGYLMRRASIAVLSDINARLARYSMRHIDFSVLQIVQTNPHANQSDVSRALDIKRANMVPLIGRLEKRGLIARKPIDGRSKAIYLTAKGRQLFKKSQRVVSECEQALIDGVPEPLQSSVLPVLRAIWTGLRAREKSSASVRTAEAGIREAVAR